MFLYAVSGIITDQPDGPQRAINQITDYLGRAAVFVGHMAGDHPNEFVIALSAFATAIFTYFLATRTRGLFKETAGLREETAVLAKFAKQQAEDMRASIAAAQRAADAAELNAEVLRATQLPSLDLVKYSTILWSEDNELVGLTISCRWQNFGPTEALRIEVNTRLKELGRGFETSEIEFVLERRELVLRQRLGAKNDIQSSYVKLTAEQLVKLWKKEIRVVLYARAAYDAVFSDMPRKVAENCAELEFLADPHTLIREPLTHLESSPVTYQFRVFEGRFRVTDRNDEPDSQNDQTENSSN
jgi:hypothetical protein